MSLYEVYDDVECPVCGNTTGHRDHGPYDPHPLDDALGGTPPPSVHQMECGSCYKIFDAVSVPGDAAVHQPAAYDQETPGRKAIRWMLHSADRLVQPCPECFPGEHDAVSPWTMGGLLTAPGDDGLRAEYVHEVCGARWDAWFDTDDDGLPVPREAKVLALGPRPEKRAAS
jgi:hypothetical protein